MRIWPPSNLESIKGAMQVITRPESVSAIGRVRGWRFSRGRSDFVGSETGGLGLSRRHVVDSSAFDGSPFGPASECSGSELREDGARLDHRSSVSAIRGPWFVSELPSRS